MRAEPWYQPQYSRAPSLVLRRIARLSGGKLISGAYAFTSTFRQEGVVAEVEEALAPRSNRSSAAGSDDEIEFNHRCLTLYNDNNFLSTAPGAATIAGHDCAVATRSSSRSSTSRQPVPATHSAL
jgi:hypothetical protein